MSLRLPAFLLALTVTSLAFGEDVDPPGRVARLSTIEGNVTFQAEDAQTPEQAEINRPVTSGDRVLTETGSRAELSFGTAAVRLDERTDLSISNLDEDIAQIELNSGAMSVHLRELSQGDTFEIDTPNATIRLTQPGDYRVDVGSDGASTLSVRNGNAEIDSGSGAVHVHDQQQARLSAQGRYADVVVLGAPDAFDDWSMDRERQLQDTESERYVSREVVGYEDLDRYGSWSSDPEYGEVWAPSVVDVGWAPYTYGRWTWVGRWGWTWVDRSPWGFAPFHYGRWAYLHQRQRWCWVPGPRHRRPMYAPALVGWQDRHGHGYSRHERPTHWVPLGPREVYVPNRHVSPRYLRNVNVGNAHIDDNTRITNAYRNRARDFKFANRDAPGVRPPNNGVRGGLVPNNQLHNGLAERWRTDRNNNRSNQDQTALNNNDRWRTGPGWRTGPNQERLLNGGNGHNGRDWRNGSNRDDRNRSGSNNGDGNNRSDGNNSVWTNRPRFDRSPSGGDGQMTIPRSPTEGRSIQRVESQRDRMRREASEAAQDQGRRLSESRSWNNGSPSRSYRDRGDRAPYRAPDRPATRTYGGENRSYGGARWGNGGGGGSVSQPRSMPSPRVEQRQSQPRAERPVQQSSQPMRQHGGRSNGESSRGAGRLGQRQ